MKRFHSQRTASLIVSGQKINLNLGILEPSSKLSFELEVSLFSIAFKPFGLEFENSRCLFTEFANLIHFGQKKNFAERHSLRQTDGQTAPLK